LPPIYRQTVRFAVWTYFLLSLIGSQNEPNIEKSNYVKDEDEEDCKDKNVKEVFIPFIPIFLIVRFIFFFGWLKVAEAIENPFGNDDDDFQVRQLVSRHLWAIGKNISLYEGPPEEGEDDDEDSEDGEVNAGCGSIKLSMNKYE